ncbi:hypothetical protein [Olleya sp. Bg11-27]|uniref:hypothetical protein n=1 Tax=Olleya sp. Bg11-27 TaxID=2058135 RepID=UPI000C314E12|nr:hypothetical protein [Olleya sp. Bg11-27]AUC76298.1 hypothetical protein CW732_11730 [Olleya sp. Bg11-27]
MKNTILPLITLLLLSFSCSHSDDTTTPTEDGTPIIVIDETTDPVYTNTIDFTTAIDYISEIDDYDIANGYMYFIFGDNIYRTDLNTGTTEHVIEDLTDTPITLQVIGNTLYFQGAWAWAVNKGIKQVDLNNISAGVQSINTITGTSRSELFKNADKLMYLSSPNGLSPTNNFYELNQSGDDQLIFSEDFILPTNTRVIGNYLYFSSEKEIRRLDLSNPTEVSTIIFTIPNTPNNNYSNGNILGFDIYENTIYFTQISNNKLLSIDLDNPEEDPTILNTNNDEGQTGYGKIIISDEKLYVKKIEDKQIDVFEI